MLRAFKIPVGWTEILKRSATAVSKDNVLGLAQELAYSFFFALFPALIFLIAVASFFPLQGLIDQLMSRAGGMVPTPALQLVTTQLHKISESNHGGLLTFGILLTIFSASSGMVTVIDCLNRAYDITEGRPWWKVRVIAIGLTIALGIFALVSLALIMVGPSFGEKIATWVHLGGAFALGWKILEWPIVFVLVVTGVGIVYYFAPDAEQEWVWITPGSALATILWVVASLGLRFYVTNFSGYSANGPYGAIGAIMALLLWMYITGIMLLVGAELNAEIEHASPYGKDPGEKTAGEKRKIGVAAARAWEEAHQQGQMVPAHAYAQQANCDVDKPTPAHPAVPPRRRHVQAPVHASGRLPASRIALAGLIVGEMALSVWARMRKRTKA